MNHETTGTTTGTAVAGVNGRRGPKEGERERILADWAAHGKKVEEVAEETGWSQWTLYRWRGRARRGEVDRGCKGRTSQRAAAGMVAVPAPSGSTALVEVETRAGRLRVLAPTAAGWVAELIRELNRC